jgi:hypothetical protein
MKLVLALIASLGIASAFAQTAPAAKKEETKKTPADKVEATAPAAAKPVAAPAAPAAVASPAAAPAAAKPVAAPAAAKCDPVKDKDCKEVKMAKKKEADKKPEAKAADVKPAKSDAKEPAKAADSTPVKK